MKKAEVSLTMEVPSEVRVKYADIIDDILSRSDLSQVTEKKIRTGIQERVQYDITPQKVRHRKRLMSGGGVNSLGRNQRVDYAKV